MSGTANGRTFGTSSHILEIESIPTTKSRPAAKRERLVFPSPEHKHLPGKGITSPYRAKSARAPVQAISTFTPWQATLRRLLASTQKYAYADGRLYVVIFSIPRTVATSSFAPTAVRIREQALRERARAQAQWRAPPALRLPPPARQQQPAAVAEPQEDAPAAQRAVSWRHGAANPAHQRASRLHPSPA
jgi:hypothetical protein